MMDGWRSVALVAIVVASALSSLLEQVAWADEPKALKVFVKVGFHNDKSEIGPIFLAPRSHLVIRSAEELAASTRKAKDAKDPAVQKDAAFQKEVQAQLAKLLKVTAIDWEKQMIVVIDGSRHRFKREVEFLSFSSMDNTSTVRWQIKDLVNDSDYVGFISTARGIALVERFDGTVQFDVVIKPK